MSLSLLWNGKHYAAPIRRVARSLGCAQRVVVAILNTAGPLSPALRNPVVAACMNVAGGRVLVRPEDIKAHPRPRGANSMPMFELGRGDRRDDCAHYDACLVRFDRATAALAGAHADCPAGQCPNACPTFTKRDRSRELLHLASSRASTEAAFPNLEGLS